MDRAAVAVVRASWESLAGRQAALVDRAFLRLLAAYPRARRHLGRNLTKPKLHLVRLLESIVRDLDEVSRLECTLAAAGERHARYGALAEHYAPARGAILAALSDLLGAKWTPLTAHAWTQALEAASGMMIRGSFQAAAAA
jgi:hemoglobin-like flavoprotein